MSAPKIVLEEAPEAGFAWVQVIVGQDGSVVVEHEFAKQGIVVSEEGDCEN